MDADVQAPEHGNDLRTERVYACPECGIGNLCDVCHDHDEPRGECSECPEVIEDGR